MWSNSWALKMQSGAYKFEFRISTSQYLERRRESVIPELLQRKAKSLSLANDLVSHLYFSLKNYLKSRTVCVALEEFVWWSSSINSACHGLWQSHLKFLRLGKLIAQWAMLYSTSMRQKVHALSSNRPSNSIRRQNLGMIGVRQWENATKPASFIEEQRLFLQSNSRAIFLVDDDSERKSSLQKLVTSLIANWN